MHDVFLKVSYFKGTVYAASSCFFNPLQGSHVWIPFHGLISTWFIPIVNFRCIPKYSDSFC